DRFNLFIDFCDGSRGEKRFQTQNKTARWVTLVYQCLGLFTPWESICVLPEKFDRNWTRIPSIPSLSFLGINPDDEHSIEKRRMHTIIHPGCFARLLQILGFAPPAECLEVPNFLLAMNNDSSENDDDSDSLSDLDNLPPPTAEELSYIWEGIAQQQLRRKSSSATVLSVVIDGVEQGYLNLNKTTRICLKLKPDANLVQIFAKEEQRDLLLTTLSIRFSKVLDEEEQWCSSILLEGGQKITIKIVPQQTSNHSSTSTIEIHYQETQLVRATRLLLYRLKFQLTQLLSLKPLDYLTGFRPALATIIILLLLTGGIWLYLRSGDQGAKQSNNLNNSQTDNPLQSKEDNKSNTNQISNQTNDNNKTVVTPKLDSSATKNRSTDSPTQLAYDPPIKRNRHSPIGSGTPTPDVLRGRTHKTIATSLLDIENVSIETRTNDVLSQQVSNILISRLQTSNRLIITNKEQADGLVKLSVTYLHPDNLDKVAVTISLVNVNGEALWPSSSKSQPHYIGSVEEVANQIVKDLLDDIERLKNNQ
ncbi:MAG: hypothetical protein AB1489_25880, partial [Acidobacteriota bacterium]